MDNEKFLIRSRQWINNKLILANTSDWYKKDARRSSAIANVKDRFQGFLTYPSNFSINNLAVLLKRHEDLLLTIMPIPNNPSYQTAFNKLSEILKYATDIVTDQNLQHMIQNAKTAL